MKTKALIGYFTVLSVIARPLATPADLWLSRVYRNARISPDGSWVVYVESWNDRDRNARFGNLRLASSDGKQRRNLTDGPWQDSSPHWSPDSARLAWISDRGGRPRIRVRPLDATENRAIETPVAPLSLAWSPDGKSLAFTATVPRETPPPSWAPPSLVPMLRAAEPVVQIFVVPAAGGDTRRLTTAELEYRGEPAWMPSGASIVCAEKGGEIFAVRVIDRVVKELTHSGEVNRDPVPSPDGSKIAYTVATARPQSYAVRRLMVMNADGTREKPLAGALDRDVRDPQWSNDSRTVYFIADDRGVSHVYAARNDGTARPITNRPERLFDFSLADNGRAVVARSTANEGSGVYTFTVDVPAGGWTLADADEKLLAERDWGAIEEIHYESAGNSVQAFLLKPPQFDPAKKYPLIVDIQDAPRRMCGPEFHLVPQILAARGFVVMCANVRGTPGFGEAFGNLLNTRYPGDDADDLLRGVDAAIAKGYVDPKRVMVTGGLVAAWLIGHSDRFASAAARRPIVDWITDVATARDGLERATNWMRAMPWDDPDQYVKRSPIFAAASFKTPTLVIAGEHDPESDELYFALQARKVESILLRLPETPQARVQEMEAVLAWFAK